MNSVMAQFDRSVNKLEGDANSSRELNPTDIDTEKGRERTEIRFLSDWIPSYIGKQYSCG
jgi:hypothetical protein